MALILTGSSGSTTLDSSAGLTFSDSSNQQYASSPYVLKNRIINGAMMIDQRNSGASVTPTATSYVSCDRWYPQLTQASKFSVQQQTTTVPTGFSFAQQFSVVASYTVSSGDYFGTEQRIEGFNTADLAWGTANAQTVTLSFWAYANNAGTYCGSLGNNGSTLSYVFTYTLTANTWTKVSVTIPGPTSGTWVGATNGIGVVVRFTLSAGSTFQTSTTNSWISGNYAVTSSNFNWIGTASATFYITGVQLEKGSTATPFEQRLYNQELANCQRYYETSFNQGTAPYNSFSDNTYSPGFNGLISFSGTNVRSNLYFFKTTKRTLPTITTYNPSTIATSGAIAGYVGGWIAVTSMTPSANDSAVGIIGTLTGATTGSSYIIGGGWAASAEL